MVETRNVVCANRKEINESKYKWHQALQYQECQNRLCQLDGCAGGWREQTSQLLDNTSIGLHKNHSSTGISIFIIRMAEFQSVDIQA